MAAGMTVEEQSERCISFLFAGHETTANTLTWTWYVLSQHLHVEQRLHAELDTVLNGHLPTVEHLPALSYTRMVIEESMRLYPSVTFNIRHTIANDEIGGYHIPANSLIWMSPYVTHRHPAFWEQPEVFEPERFTAEGVASRPRFAYFPFGGGPHLCIGNSFAMMEAQLLLATVAQRYRLRLLPGHKVEPKVVLTLHPKDGLPMTLQERG